MLTHGNPGHSGRQCSKNLVYHEKKILLESGETRNEMMPEKETMTLFMELQTLEDRGVGIWMEGQVSSPKKVSEVLAVNEESIYMRDYIFQEGVLKELHFDKITDR